MGLWRLDAGPPGTPPSSVRRKTWVSLRRHVFARGAQRVGRRLALGAPVGSPGRREGAWVSQPPSRQAAPPDADRPPECFPPALDTRRLHFQRRLVSPPRLTSRAENRVLAALLTAVSQLAAGAANPVPAALVALYWSSTSWEPSSRAGNRGWGRAGGGRAPGSIGPPAGFRAPWSRLTRNPKGSLFEQVALAACAELLPNADGYGPVRAPGLTLRQPRDAPSRVSCLPAPNQLRHLMGAGAGP